MGCAESKDSSISSSRAKVKVKQAVQDIEKDRVPSSPSSGMGSSASTAPHTPEDGKTKPKNDIPEEDPHDTLGSILNSDLGESLDARRLRGWPKTSIINQPQGIHMPSSTSAHSAKSAESGDSGIYELDVDYSFVITESSPQNLVYRVEKDFTPVENLDLTITGKACPRLLSGSQRVRQEEKTILENLRKEGFISTTKQRAGGGLAFEIVEATPLTESAGAKLNPQDFMPAEHKQYLDSQRNKHSLVNLTSEDLHRRQTLAEQRRLFEQDAKLTKINTVTKPSKDPEEKIEEIKMKADQKDNAALEKRTAHLKDLRDKIKAQNKRGQQARLKKLINAPPCPVPVTAKGLKELQDDDDIFFN